MKITVEFGSIEEMMTSIKDLEKLALQAEIGKASIEGNNEAAKYVEAGKKITEELNRDNDQSLEEMVEKQAEKPKKKKAEAKAEEPEEAPEKEEPKVDAVEVRKLLTKVNKAAGKNMAKEWIAELGHEALTDVVDAEELAQLKAKAEEYLDA